MSVTLPDIDFARIRPYGQPASRSNAFEELSSTLIEESIFVWPEGVRFERFGNPDGGREGRGVLQNGDVWAWQAKYIFEFNASAAGQITSSVKRALEREPTLRRYFVACPFDLPAGDTGDRESAHTRWTAKVESWQELARAKGLDVEFVFVGLHQMVAALTEALNAGRARYWFSADILTADWLARRLGDVIAKLGRRYTPELHVEVPAVQALQAVGRETAYLEQWQTALAALRASRRWTWRAPGPLAGLFGEALGSAATALTSADAAVAAVIGELQSVGLPAAAAGPLAAAAESVQRVSDLLYEHCLEQHSHFVGEAASLYAHVRDASGALERAGDLERAAAGRAARARALLLVGRAGVGKTHLLCDVARARLADGRPTILIAGQDFDGRALLPQLAEMTQLGGSADDVLAVLDAAAEATGCIGLLMIDALNEGERPERWCDEVRVLVQAAARYRHVGIVLSCRTEFVGRVVGDLAIPRVEHVGFAEATGTAIRRFTREYGLEQPAFPVWNPEFGNPLFLKLACEALVTLGEDSLPFGSAGVAAICRAFLDAVNRRLSGAGRCDYDEFDNPVGAAVRELAKLGDGPMPRADVQRITTAVLPNRPWSTSLLLGLIAEGVLNEIAGGRIVFGYQRLGDIIRAEQVASRSPELIRSWLQELGDDRWREDGLLGALAVIVPERHQVELIDLGLDDSGAAPFDRIDGFVNSIPLRSPASVSSRAVELVELLLEHEYWRPVLLETIVGLACVPGHRLNADWLHGRLSALDVGKRDVEWSVALTDTAHQGEETAVGRLLEWAWPTNSAEPSVLPDDVARLAVQLLGWLTASSDRRVRDRATKAIVCIAGRAPVGFASGLRRFGEVNDPYVIERMAAAACGTVLRTDDRTAIVEIADAAQALIAKRMPEHLLTRDYLRRTFEFARSVGWSGPAADPPYGAAWPVKARSQAEIEAMIEPEDTGYGLIWRSLTGFGDFGRYIIEPALRDLQTTDRRGLLRTAQAAIFDRVVDLGWTPERFCDSDRGIARRRSRNEELERIGKKYQWIGFYETLGRITDHHLIQTQPSEAPAAVTNPEQVTWRDIDPTLLARKPEPPRARERQWFSPVGASFESSPPAEYPLDTSAIPDPLDLITLIDSSGVAWLALAGSPAWEQPLPPELLALQTPRHAVWLQLHAYLVPLSDAERLRAWADGKDWFGRWMPERPDLHGVLLGGHPDSLEWAAADGDSEWRGREEPPTRFEECAAWYGGMGTARDASADEQTRGYVPSRQLLDILRLRRGVDFVWRDVNGVGVHDPSVAVGGPATLLMRRDLLPRLADAGRSIFWTVLVGCELHHDTFASRDDNYRWISASASYIVDDGAVEHVARLARRYRSGPTTESELDWAPKRTKG
ncbi:ATP-binding protein [Dactylosporangium salmoneum]|uniref:ATP-binding protein n=1 Tax=Dactylosporangium salmoneum TaxID=53361 RepID=A0ABN3HW70_9ACTN